MKDNKCDFPHRQSSDKRNQRPSEFCVFFDHPSQRSPKTPGKEQHIVIQYRKPPSYTRNTTGFPQTSRSRRQVHAGNRSTSPRLIISLSQIFTSLDSDSRSRPPPVTGHRSSSVSRLPLQFSTSSFLLILQCSSSYPPSHFHFLKNCSLCFSIISSNLVCRKFVPSFCKHTKIYSRLIFLLRPKCPYNRKYCYIVFLNKFHHQLSINFL